MKLSRLLRDQIMGGVVKSKVDARHNWPDRNTPLHVIRITNMHRIVQYSVQT